MRFTKFMRGRQHMKKIPNICKKNILVVGDIMLDTYYKGDVQRISPEAPVPVFHKIA